MLVGDISQVYGRLSCMGQQITGLLTGSKLTCPVLQVQMGLEKQEAKHHMKACWTNREVYETFPDQSGIFPEHSINASNPCYLQLWHFNLALLNNAMINYEITALIYLHVSKCTTVKFLQFKNSIENLSSLYTGSKPSFLTRRAPKSNIWFLYDLQKGPQNIFKRNPSCFLMLLIKTK